MDANRFDNWLQEPYQKFYDECENIQEILSEEEQNWNSLFLSGSSEHFFK